MRRDNQAGRWFKQLFRRSAEETESSRELIERRIQLATEEAVAAQTAAVSLLLAELRESNERRIETAAQQAMSYADHSVTALAASLSGVAKALAQLKRQVRSTHHIDQQDILPSVTTSGNEAAGIETGRREIDQFRGTVNGLPEQIPDRVYNSRPAIEPFKSGLESGLKNIEESDRSSQPVQSQISQALTKPDSTGFHQPSVRIDALDRTKLARLQRSGLKLSLGRVHDDADGYINIATERASGVDIVSDLLNMPFNCGEIEEITAFRTVERFTPSMLETKVLPYWKDILKPGGRLITISSDGESIVEAVNNGAMSFDSFRTLIFAYNEASGTRYNNLMTVDSYRRILHNIGFVEIKEVDLKEERSLYFDFKIVAYKP